MLVVLNSVWLQLMYALAHPHYVSACGALMPRRLHTFTHLTFTGLLLFLALSATGRER